MTAVSVYGSRVARFPSVHILGASKAGSTSLHILFVRLGGCGCTIQTYCRTGKELSIWYGNHPQMKYYTADQYTGFFQHQSSTCRLSMDSTPSRLDSWYAPRELARLAAAAQRQTPTLRFIALLREPIARHLSWFNHRLAEPIERTGNWSWSFWEQAARACPSQFGPLPVGFAPPHNTFVQCEHDLWRKHGGCQSNSSHATDCWKRAMQSSPWQSVLAGGIYAPQLALWSAAFPRRQLIVLQFEQLLQEGAARALEFAGLSASSTRRTELPHVNTKPSRCHLSEVSCTVVRALKTIFDPWNDFLTARLRHDHSAGRAPDLEPIFLPFSPPSCTEVQQLPRNLSLC